ncbi:formylglycine-generating enzyme family protein [Zhouia spongiae]|uniref:Formylglycine-generating enzyme family protein n=1 Tax=Zhouia spongiae TaxID=2202721 RepID=A0ABY3YLL8_9FLAO|nr:SUMF1/EgtB/PvdO family nonheme iron enzyme [Zhouia spongiae]UNY98727.1 formylglycine-generating enzyme family protein [Zhouia spongiae]
MKISKNSSLILITFLLANLSIGQKSENYTQSIAGSDLTIEMISIPEGNFAMGSKDSDNNANSDEFPAGEVKISPFWMSKYEITWELFYLYLNREIDGEENKSKGNEVTLEADAISGATIPYVDMSLGMGTGSGLPIVNVTHLAASKFCEWLSAKTGHFYRLPTEAEWEYACRAGSETEYSFETAESIGDHAWYKENSNGTYHKVGEKKPNAWGLYDMHGNVAELVLDGYQEDAYKKRKKKNRENPVVFPESEYPTVVRGGSWIDDRKQLRSAMRLPSTPDWKRRDPQFPKSKWWHTDAPFVGFRIVRVLTPPDQSEYEKYWGPKEIE